MSFSNIVILNIKCADYCCIISGIRKSEAVNLFQRKKWNIIKHKRLLSHIKMVKEILTFCNIKIKKHKSYAIKVLFARSCGYYERISI